MFNEATDMMLGIPVVHSAYPDGEEGIQKSISVICEKIREGAPTAAMKSFAGNMMKEAGFPQTILAQGQVVLDNIRSRAMYTPDAMGTEQIQSAMVTWCVPGAPICIPIYDCDDGVTAVGTVMAALGHEVEVVRQKFGGGHQQHVLVEVRGENGEWIPLDPSSKTMPAGKKAFAEYESRHSPYDGSKKGAQFVGIGALPIIIWKHEKWERVGVGATVETAATSCCQSCAEGKTCDGDACGMDRKGTAMSTYHAHAPHQRGGFGAPWPGVTAFVPQWAWLRQAWPALDAHGRTWDETIASAYTRGEAQSWVAGDPTSRSDLIALIIASTFSARAVASMPDQGQRAADDMNRTWFIIAQKLGYTPDLTIDDLKKRVQKEQSPANATAALALFELIIVVVAIVANAVIACFAIYFAAKIIDSLLSRIVAFAELIYLQIQVQKIVDRHLANPDLPWTDAEKKMLDNLEGYQQGAHNAVTNAPVLSPPDKGDGTPGWIWAGAGVVVVGGVLAIVYKDEIKSWLHRRKGT
jgi:hypothetical protein